MKQTIEGYITRSLFKDETDVFLFTHNPVFINGLYHSKHGECFAISRHLFPNLNLSACRRVKITIEYLKDDYS